MNGGAKWSGEADKRGPGPLLFIKHVTGKCQLGMGQATFPNGLFSGGRSPKLQCQMIGCKNQLGNAYQLASDE
jgi:hypothetical protein